MGNKGKNSSKNMLSLIVIILAIVVVFYMATANNTDKKVTLPTFYQHLEEGKVTNVSMSANGVVKYRLTGSSTDASKFPDQYDFYFNFIFGYQAEELENTIKTFNENVEKGINNEGGFEEYKDYAKVYPVYLPAETSFIAQLLPYLSLATILLIGFFMYRMLSGKGSGANSFGKSRAKLSEKSSIKFSDIAGAEEEKEETQEIVEFLKNPTKFKQVGARIPKGVLLVGQPGTGKTLLAKAVAGESNVPFFSISGSDFVELYVGVGASRVRDLFATAKRNSPCIIFIDEIDAVGRQRGAGLGGGNDEREQTLNQLLVEMDGFEGNSGIIVLAATNRADVLDPALLRAGRFDRQIYVNVPDVKGREGIIKIHAKNKTIDKDVDFKQIARLTSGFTGADIESFLNEAAILAARDSRLIITMEDITEGINKVIMGPQKKSRLITEKDKKITAYHEAGHAIIAKLLDSGDSVHEVSIIPRGMAGGYTSTRPSDDDEHFTFNRLNNKISMMMGGRVAEELVFGDITAGASSDISRATEVARKMVTEWGMSKKLGFINLGKGAEVFLGRDYQAQKSYSEETAALIDAEMKEILDINYKRAVKILSDNRDILDNMSNLLLEKETIYSEEVDKIMAGVNYKEIAKELDKKEKNRKKKEEKRRKEAELEKARQLHELKVKAAEALSSAGVISKQELELIKEESKRLEQELSVSEKADKKEVKKEQGSPAQKEAGKQEKPKTVKQTKTTKENKTDDKK